MTIRSLARTAAALGLAFASLAACGGDDDGTDTTTAPVATSAAAVTTTAVGSAAPSTDAPDTTEPPTTAAPTTAAADTTAAVETTAAVDTSMDHTEPDLPIVSVGLVDYAFGGLPASVAAGTTLEVTNGSTHELHELVAFRLPDGETRPVDELVALPEEEILPLVGEPAMVLIAPPGQDGIAVVGDGTLTEPGRYVVICAIPTGADPQAYLDAAATSDGPPDVPGGPPHFTQGMFAELTVEPAGG